MHHGTGTHCTRLKGYIQGSSGNTVIAKLSGGFTQYLHFSMGGRIDCFDGCITARGYNLSIHNYNRTNRHFSARLSSASQLQGQTHKLLIRMGNMQLANIRQAIPIRWFPEACW